MSKNNRVKSIGDVPRFRNGYIKAKRVSIDMNFDTDPFGFD